MSDRAPPPYTIVVAEPPFNTGPQVSPNYSSITPPHPQDLVCPDRGPNAYYWVLGVAKVVGLANSWIQTKAAVHGVPDAAQQSIKGWDNAVAIYTEAYNNGNVRIVHMPAAHGQAHHPISVSSSPVPGAAHSAAYSTIATPARIGGSENPVSVHSSPAPVSPSPVHNANRLHPMPVLGIPTLAPAVTYTTPATGTRHHPVSVQSSPAGPLTPKRPSTPTFNSHTAQSTPAPVTPQANGRETASQARLRVIEDALEHYGARNNVTVPLPATPASHSDYDDRITAIEDCLNDLLTREALRASTRDVSFNAERRAFLTAMFERVRSDFLARRGYDVEGTASAQGSETDNNQTSPPPQSPAAGSSTGPGTTSAAAQQDSEDCDYFAGFKDDEYTEEELARLNRLLDGEPE